MRNCRSGWPVLFAKEFKQTMSSINIPTPLVSVVMAAYNAERYITESVNTVLAQTYPHWELIIVNDGSTDSTPAIAQEYSESDSRIMVLTQPNQGLGPARNAGIRQAKGDWLVFLDADDLWDPKILEKQISVSERYPDVDVIFTDGWIFNNDDLNETRPYPTISGYFSAEEMYRLEYETNYIPVQTAMVSRKMVRKIGLQQVIVRCCEDWDYWLRVARAGGNFYGIDEKLFYYRRHDSNMSNNVLQMLYAKLSVLIWNFDPARFKPGETQKIFLPLLYSIAASLIRRGRK